MAGYERIEGLGQVLLENSYVLTVLVEPGAVCIEADLLLLEEHADYSAPNGTQKQCFRRGRLRFENLLSVAWTMPTVLPATDANGETDWGGVDHFEVGEGAYELAGDFGRLAIVGGSVRVEVEHAESS